MFTLDVTALYPSIKPSNAHASLRHALGQSNFTEGIRSAIFELVELIFNNSFICFQGEVYMGKEGIPTGNCVSRQIADVTLHNMLFEDVKPLLESLWKWIAFWKRFIDDILGIWTGTLRQFDLNALTAPYGIQFGDF